MASPEACRYYGRPRFMYGPHVRFAQVRDFVGENGKVASCGVDYLHENTSITRPNSRRKWGRERWAEWAPRVSTRHVARDRGRLLDEHRLLSAVVEARIAASRHETGFPATVGHLPFGVREWNMIEPQVLIPHGELARQTSHRAPMIVSPTLPRGRADCRSAADSMRASIPRGRPPVGRAARARERAQRPAASRTTPLDGRHGWGVCQLCDGPLAPSASQRALQVVPLSTLLTAE